jgi:hypothetical protein
MAKFLQKKIFIIVIRVNSSNGVTAANLGACFRK